MQTRKLGDLEVPALGLGCMSMTPIYGEPDPQKALETLLRAPDLGVRMLDTSDAYGGKGRNEELVAKALAKGGRDRYLVCSKFGNLRNPDGSPGVNGRPEYVAQACEASLKRLGIETLDLYYQHRVDPSVPIEETVGAMARLKQQGKIRHLGLSEASAKTIRRAHATHRISALESEYSLWTREMEAEILPTCRELGIGYVAYGTLGRGFLTGALTSAAALPAGDIRREMPRFQGDNFAHNAALVAELARLAKIEKRSPAQLALGWVLSRGADIVPIVGASRIEKLEENVAAVSLPISPQTLAALDKAGAARGERTVKNLLPRLGL
jgi:aryl-alcohol dehydrogenase-like predicted oxidoreductase